MEVILKKTKITKSIVNQALRGSNSLYLNHFNYDILGWCLLNGKRDVRWVLIYNRLNNTLIRVPYVERLKDDEITSKNVQTTDRNGGYTYPLTYFLSVYFKDESRIVAIFSDEDKNKVVEEQNKLIEFTNEVRIKGQIFI